MSRPTITVATTTRAVINKIRLDDAPFLYELFRSPGWMKFIGDRKLNTIADVKTYIQSKFIQVYQEHGFGYYLIQSLIGENIGVAGFLKKPYLQNPDYGFALMPAFHKSGYGYEVGQALLEYGEQNFGFTVLDAVTMPDNIASQKLLEKLGFSQLSTIKLPDKAQPDLLYRWYSRA